MIKSMAWSALGRGRSKVAVRGGHLRLLPDPNAALQTRYFPYPSLSPCLSLICPFLGRWGGDAARLSKPVQRKDRKSQANTPHTTTEAK